jgi:hypothetical protein
VDPSQRRPGPSGPARLEVRAELLALLGTDDSAQRRERRLEAARRELEDLELRWKVEGWEP